MMRKGMGNFTQAAFWFALGIYYFLRGRGTIPLNVWLEGAVVVLLMVGGIVLLVQGLRKLTG
jgi:hypothetical protein